MTPEFAAAFVALQADLPTIVKDSTNPHFKNKYASNDTIVETLRPLLAKHKFALTHSAQDLNDGKAILIVSRLFHASGGEALTNTVYIPLVKQDAQGAVGAVTYGRRCGTSALLSLATDEDDDGNGASRAPQARKTAQRPSDSPPPSDPFSGQRGAAHADRTFKGQRLGDIPTDDLQKILKWARKPERINDTKPLAESIGVVLADRSLGLDADGQVARMKAAVEKETAELPWAKE